MSKCRGCGNPEVNRVLDLGHVPASDHFPYAADPVTEEETSHALAMDLCTICGLAQLADDDTVADEPRGVEPQALRDQAEDAVARAATAGWLRGESVTEFGSPHGGSWLPLLERRGLTRVDGKADVVVDCLGITHEPDQLSAFELRAKVVNPDGVLLLLFPSLATMVTCGQWNALRHGHFAYYSLTSLVRLLGAVGLQVATAWEFDLYGGSVVVAAVPRDHEPDDSVRRILTSEATLGITDPAVVGRLQDVADEHVEVLRSWLIGEQTAGRTVYAYGAASRAVALFSRAKIDSSLLAGVADASPAKQGRRMPGTDIPIVSPGHLVEVCPDRVLLTLPDLFPEISTRFPELDGRWELDRA
ncbi:transferase [Mycolicibacterium smegmatis]|uniref:transferase n=1 Tax=Mycolicibacterium smegmatis TaxID=1772 RepID=UPI00055C176E|nr:transferase [Mycolicibacterium smegmatis]